MSWWRKNGSAGIGELSGSLIRRRNPRCALCKIEVSLVRNEERFETLDRRLTWFCHGQQEVTVFTRKQEENSPNGNYWSLLPPNLFVPVSDESFVTGPWSVGVLMPTYFGVSSFSVMPGSGSIWLAPGVLQPPPQPNGNRPRCAVCNKPVDNCQVRRVFETPSVRIQTNCHGEQEVSILPADELIGDPKVPIGYVAFAEKARALLLAKLPEVQVPTVRLITLEE